MKMKTDAKTDQKIEDQMCAVSELFKELRFAEGKNQDGYLDQNLSRRQIQRAECPSSNLTMKKLFTMIDHYGYVNLHEFFEGLE
jgi:hypothetical protein